MPTNNTSPNPELCLNWWPSNKPVEVVEGMPHPECVNCANWLPDIEDIMNKKSQCCGNIWPKNKVIVKNPS